LPAIDLKMLGNTGGTSCAVEASAIWKPEHREREEEDVNVRHKI
jgi:hypothetical protein